MAQQRAAKTDGPKRGSVTSMPLQSVELDQSYGVYGNAGEADVPAPSGNSAAPGPLTVELVFTDP